MELASNVEWVPSEEEKIIKCSNNKGWRTIVIKQSGHNTTQVPAT